MAKMDMRLTKVTIRELTEGFVDNADEGVKGCKCCARNVTDEKEKSK